MGELGALFNPGMRHELEERQAKAARREEEGNAKDGDLRIDLESGVAVINAPGEDETTGPATAADDERPVTHTPSVDRADAPEASAGAETDAAAGSAGTAQPTASETAASAQPVSAPRSGRSDRPATSDQPPTSGSPATSGERHEADQPAQQLRPRGKRRAAAGR